ncbi:16S rRNA (guanine(527)-N(7))-methyltransferase RsmG [Cerasibacillus terrae]|uniref:Ribosomal RNA small subunit methyltransferase G n=1 Tax=Cerasibacillus terrae TaxID=2498845 RepID=A0A5C8NNT5_9BACI|nr:16S rRNA (guanine(527)-N(7))-methyltransferase RsmG [Cerasibacillus terrae]TXL63389.1 16S rRNA (guanine(527)-N(7))-methyltransferase RsmG [Cerasibacillus terrae]
MNPTEFSSELQKQGIILSDQQKKQFSIYFQTLIEWNEKMNLTALTEEGDVYLKHFYDSISAAFYYDFTKKINICDVGAGAGFPSIPLKICFPHLEITIVDSLKKRIGFLNHLAEELELEGVHFYHGRAEDFGKNKQFRGKFDLVLARAVARMSVLSELCLPLCKKEGHFIAMKGAQGEEELNNAKKAIKTLGGRLSDTYLFNLPKEDSERTIIVIDKEKDTPKKYPRKPGTPNRQPIE